MTPNNPNPMSENPPAFPPRPTAKLITEIESLMNTCGKLSVAANRIQTNHPASYALNRAWIQMEAARNSLLRANQKGPQS